MKRNLLCIALWLAGLSALRAQIIHDPNDGIYRDLDRWALQGCFTQSLPMIRPYPPQLVEALLVEALERGNEAAAEKAGRYLQRLNSPRAPKGEGEPKPRSVYRAPAGRGVLHAGFTGGAEGLDGDASLLGGPFADASLRLTDWLAGSLSMYVYGSTRDPEEGYNVPGTYSPYPDLVADWSEIGDWEILQNWTSALTIGTGGLYFQAGLIRSSMGPFYDNGVILGPQASRAGHFGLAYRRPRWSFEMLWLELTAADTRGQGRYAEKHLVSHALNFRPVPAVEISFMEAVVWGGRIEPLYLLPLNNLFAAQSMAEFGDNSLLGFLFRWSFARNAQLLTQLYIDDLHFNDLIQGNFNTKYKLAGEFGFAFAPETGPLLSLAADYTAVFPYMYTHLANFDKTKYPDRYKTPEINYQDYSHAGRNLGPDLEPNSDRISVRSAWRTLPGLDLNLSASLIRHGNASENSIDEGRMNSAYHDGSIFDDGNYDYPPYDNNYMNLRFLIQPVLETLLACGIGAVWTCPTRLGDFSLSAEYAAEYGWNRGCVPESNGLRHYWSLTGVWRY